MLPAASIDAFRWVSYSFVSSLHFFFFIFIRVCLLSSNKIYGLIWLMVIYSVNFCAYLIIAACNLLQPLLLSWNIHRSEADGAGGRQEFIRFWIEKKNKIIFEFRFTLLGLNVWPFQMLILIALIKRNRTDVRHSFPFHSIYVWSYRILVAAHKRKWNSQEINTVRSCVRCSYKSSIPAIQFCARCHCVIHGTFGAHHVYGNNKLIVAIRSYLSTCGSENSLRSIAKWKLQNQSLSRTHTRARSRFNQKWVRAAGALCSTFQHVSRTFVYISLFFMKNIFHLIKATQRK